jgi:hypothetical protein
MLKIGEELKELLKKEILEDTGCWLKLKCIRWQIKRGNI